MPRAPEGSKVTDLTALTRDARQTGFLQRVSQSVRYVIAGVKPDTWMSPDQPLAPVAQEVQGRRYDYRVGHNLYYVPRGEEIVGFQALRALADNCDLVRLSIETRKDQVGAQKWNIVNRDPKLKSKEDPRILKIEGFLAHPQKFQNWNDWIRQVVEEVLVTDALAIYPRLTIGKQLYALEMVDGALMKVLIDDSGRTPLPPSPAYQQYLKGMPAVDYTTDELLYRPRNRRVHKVYGYSPVEQIIMTVNIALRRSYSQLQYFTEGNIPEAYANVPKEWTPQQIDQFQDYWDTLIEGVQRYKRKVKFVPGDTKVTEIRGAPIKDEFDEWLARIVSKAFSLPPTPYVKQTNRATADTQQEAALKEGLAPLTLWIKEIMDEILVTQFGAPDLQFSWQEEEPLDPQGQATVLGSYLKMGVLSVNEVRSKLGEDPVDGGDTNLIYTATGAAPLSSVLNAPAQQAKPDGEAAEPAAEPAGEPDGEHVGKAALPDRQKKKLAQSFEVALDECGKSAAKQLNAFGKAAADGNAPTIKPEEFAHALDLEPLSLAWDDYVQELQVSAANGHKLALLRVKVDEPNAVTDDMMEARDPQAVQWAESHAAEMLTKNGQGGELADATRDMVRKVVADGLTAKHSREEIAKELEDSYAFSPERAELIAQTEVRLAEGHGLLTGYVAAGMKYKRWLLSNDPNICPLCEANADQGWIEIGTAFSGGVEAPLQHPRCQCDLIASRTKGN